MITSIITTPLNSDASPQSDYTAFEVEDDQISDASSDSSSTNALNINNDNEGDEDETDFNIERNVGALSSEDTNWQRRWTLLLYSLTTVLLFADQNLLAPNLSQAAEEFGFDDNERDKKLGGDIALAFFLLGAPASFLVGCAADSNSIRRSFLFGLVVLIGEGACMLTYFTTTYTGLYITRALTGFSVGGALPLLSSVLGDWYKPEERSKVMASVGVGTGIGIAIGQGLAGLVGPIYGWRLPFLLISLPALLLAVLLMTTVVDPVRGGCESGDDDDADIDFDRRGLHAEADVTATSAVTTDYAINGSESFIDNSTINKSLRLRVNSATRNVSVSEPMQQEGSDRERNRESSMGRILSLCRPSTYAEHFRTTKELLSSKTVLLTLLQGAPGCVPWGIVNTFLNDFLSEDCGMTVRAATATILFFGIGNFFGIIVGGIGGDWLYKKDPRFPLLLSGSMAILGCFPLWILVNTTEVVDDEIPLFMMIRIGFIAILAGVGSGVTGPIVKSTLQNTTRPNARGQAFALLNTFDDFGRGLGPVFVAMLIINLGGRQTAFNVGIGGWILCGIFNLCMFFTVKEDETYSAIQTSGSVSDGSV